MNYQERKRRTATERRRHERMRGMKAEHWVPLQVVGTHRIDRVEGWYLVEFTPSGKLLGFLDQYRVRVKAFEVRHPDGVTHRFATLKEAKAFAVA